MNALQYDISYKSGYKGTTLYFDYPNNRLKILDHAEVPADTIKGILNISRRENFGKVITYCRIRGLSSFRASGFIVEGMINGFYKGEDAFCLSYFVDKDRSISLDKDEEDSIIAKCMKNIVRFNYHPKESFNIRNVSENDIPQMIDLFSKTFKTYPSPVFNSEYLKEVMKEKVLFKAVEDNGRIVSIASAELDCLNLNAEISDCATYPEYQGRGMLSVLIHALETELTNRGYYTLYSLSRAINPGINYALRKCAYKYGGRLIKNCHICGNFEDMNIWFKQLKKG